MSRHSLLDVYDRLSGGEFRRTLAGWKAEGLKPTEIAFRLRTEKQLAVDPSTVRRWLLTLDAPEGGAA